MKKSIFTGIIILFSGVALCQTSAESEAIMTPIKALFNGMNAGDSALIHSAFVNEVTFVSVFMAKNGKPALRPELLNEFLKAVGTAHPERWNEPIWDVKVEVDGNFAQVWAKYAFYLGKKFSHCGVDAFHLFKGEDGRWKIFHLADTRQKEGCEVPKSVSDQFR